MCLNHKNGGRKNLVTLSLPADNYKKNQNDPLFGGEGGTAQEEKMALYLC